MYLIDGLSRCDDVLFRAADDRRKDGADEVVRREQPWCAAGGIGCRALRDALTVVARVDCAVVRGWPARERGASA